MNIMAMDNDSVDNLEKMFQTFTDATLELQKSQEILKNRVDELTIELDEKNKELRRKEHLAAIGEMSASIAHEIRNPLGGIELYVSLLKKKSDDSGSELCDKILSGVSSLNKIVEDLLTYAKDYVPSSESFSLIKFIASLVDCVENIKSSKNIELNIKNELNDAPMMGDKFMLHQVFLNILLNAMQAVSKNGKVNFNIIKNENSYIFTIEDDGEGIPDDIKPEIFKPFFTTKSTGSGLGLPIVNRLVEAHQGQITVSNGILGGAKFSVELPIN
ncbi:MAG: hypothetical protein COA79_01045 [Planctomycetota bacterium]|nr:MAG: hypothetical protein COA79_01045 [Planctomycetota bacterium]